MASMLVTLIDTVNYKNQAWQEDLCVPSSCSITITSIAPLSVAGLIEFHVLDTDPPILLTYCISFDDCQTWK